MKITCDNVYCYVRKSPTEEYREFNKICVGIDRVLSAAVPGAWFSQAYKSRRWDGKHHFFDGRNFRFPAGLLPRVLRHLDAETVDYDLDDQRVTTTRIQPCITENSLKGARLRKYQLEGVQACMAAVRGVLGAATNSGKTEMACALMYAINVPTLFLTHRAELFRQTIKTIRTRLDETVGVLGQGQADDLDARIVVAMVPTLKAQIDEREKWLTSFEMVITDEFHRGGATSYQEILSKCTSARWRYGLSGTPDGKDTLDKMKMEAMTGPIVYRISNSQLIDLGVSSKPTIHLVEQHAPVGYWDVDYRLAVESLIVGNSDRNAKICRLAIDSVSCEKQCLIIVNHIAHGENIQSLFQSVHGVSVPFIHGSSDREYRKECLDSFGEGDIDVLIASTILKEGVNIPTIGTLIYACAGRSKTSLLQTIGRCLRLNKYSNKVDVFEFVDYTNCHLAKHSMHRIDIMTQEGFSLKLYEDTRDSD